MLDLIVGGYSPYTCDISPEARKSFDEAIKNHKHLGVDYTPVAVSTQSAGGSNYKFFCNARAVTPSAYNQAAIISIYAPLEGEAHVTDIKPV